MARYPHPVNLNDEQEKKFKQVYNEGKNGLSITDIFMIAVEELLKNKD